MNCSLLATLWFCALSMTALSARADKGVWSRPLDVSATIDGKLARAKMLVRTPVGYERDHGSRRYPLVLALHGWGHSAAQFKKDGELGRMADESGVVIAVPDMGKTVYETQFYPETRGAWASVPGTRWIGEVVLPFMRANYAVFPERAQTSIVGYSTGGRGALLVAESYPEFGFAGSLSGTFDLFALEPNTGEYRIHANVYGDRKRFGTRWSKDDGVSKELAPKLLHVEVFLAHGAEDKTVLFGQSETMARVLKAAGGAVTHATVKGAGHDWAFWNTLWAPMFAAMTRGFAAASSVAMPNKNAH